MKALTAFCLGATAILLVLYLACFHYTEAYQLSITRNYFTGEVDCDQVGGFHLTPPWVFASRVDLRPTRVCITTTARNYNCKLVEFVPTACREFVAVQGFRYYWWANRISFNWGYSEEYRGMKDILRGHAFGVQKYEFLRVLQEYVN